MTDASRLAIVLVRPDSPENVRLAARGMANTGFADLRLVGPERLEPPAWRTAIHAEAIIDGAHFFPLLSFDEAFARVREYPAATRVGIVFGNERTGLTQEELGLANVRFHIPQSARQPSYNLGVAVTLTLHALAFPPGPPPALRRHPPLDHAAQAEAGRRFAALLDGLGFMHDTNRDFIVEKVQDIFFRMALTAKDRDIILALFRKGLEGPRPRRPRTNPAKEKP